MISFIKSVLLFFLLTVIINSEPLHAQNKCSCSESALPLEDLRHSAIPACKARFYELQAEDFISKREFDSANLSLTKAISIYTNQSCDKNAYKKAYKLFANLHHNTGSYPLSLEYSLKLLSIVEVSNSRIDEADCLLTISMSFNRMKQSEKGIQYARIAISKIQPLSPSIEKADLLHKAAARYLWYYQDSKNLNLLDSAEQFTKEQLRISRQYKDSNLLRKSYNLMNGYAHEKKDYKKALMYLDSSFMLLDNRKDLPMIATNYGDRADVLMEMGNYKEARRFADSCLLLHQQSKNPGTIANAYALIYQVSERSGNYKDALWGMTNYIDIHDSLTKVEKTKTINELEKKYNQAKNEKTIKELAQERKIYLLLAAAGLLALIAIGFFIRQQSLKSKQKILETEQRLNRARMNPHFFFNALSSLQSFALRENDGKSIATNLSKFSHIMRETLESSYKEYITIENEMEFLTEYLELQQIRFPEKFLYEVIADDALEIDDLLIPSMIIQPFVENSIEHGFSGLAHQGIINVHFTKKGEELYIEISDNGQGLSAYRKEDDHISRATQIIKDRIYLLN